MNLTVGAAQNDPRALELLAASLRCDHYSRSCQGAYVAVALIGPFLLLLSPSFPKLVNDLTGLMQGIFALITLGYSALWRERGSNLRADFERRVFGFPAWLTESDLRPERISTLSKRFTKDSGTRRRMENWFELPPGLSRSQEVITSVHQSVKYGQKLRSVWSVVLGFLALALGLLIGAIVLLIPSTTDAGWQLTIITVTLVPVLISQSISAWRYSRDRRRLARMIESYCAQPVLDISTTAMVVHERLVAIRKYRVLIPGWLYLIARGPLHRSARLRHALFAPGTTGKATE